MIRRIEYHNRRRLMGRFLTQPPIELLREDPASPLTQAAINAMTAQMGRGWRVWLEHPFNVRRASNAIWAQR
jgi:hypothetical protein